MTSVAIAPPAFDEPVSPELALVDPELRERLRALLPEPEIELEPPPPLLRALPDPDPEESLHVTPPPLLVDDARPYAAVAVQHVPVYVHPTRGDRLRSFGRAFVLGAVVATVVTVGVIAEMGEEPATPQDPSTTPPLVAAPTPAPKPATGGAATRKPKPTKAPGAARTGGGRSGAQTKAGTTRAKPDRRSPKAGAQTAGGAAGQEQAAKRQKPVTAPVTTPPKRFAWAPVDGAVGYRFELFRGDKRVLEVRTKAPAYELASRWRHAGRTETLKAGSYRWEVWPVLRNGRADAAVVQARLTVP